MNLRLFDFMTYRLKYDSIAIEKYSLIYFIDISGPIEGVAGGTGTLINYLPAFIQLIQVLLSLQSLPNASAHQTIFQFVQV
jgi:hypothetical protein